MIYKKYGVYSMIQVMICCKNLYVKLKDSGLMGMVVLVLYTIHVVRTVQYLIVQVLYIGIADAGLFYVRILYNSYKELF